MKNNKLIKYKENIFIRLFNFFKKFFSRKNIPISKNIIEETVTNSKYKTNFFENVNFKESEEKIRLRKLQLLYDNGEIDEDDLSEEDMNKLIEIYEKETYELNTDTERRKNHIAQMLKELKSSRL